MNCREATLLSQKKQEGRLSLGERLGLKFHLLICSVCRVYYKQTEEISRQVRLLSDSVKLTLPEDARKRIEQDLQNKISNP